MKKVLIEIENLYMKDGKLVQLIDTTTIRTKRSSSLALPCQQLCGHQLRRFHFSCIACRKRRAIIGKLPQIVEVEVYAVLVLKHRPRWKQLLFRYVATILEFLAS